MSAPSVDRAPGAAPPPAPARDHPTPPGPGHRFAHGVVVAVVVIMCLAGVGFMWLAGSIGCGADGTSCTADDLGSIDRASRSAALMVLMVGVPVVALAVHRARWKVTAACSLGVVGLAAGLAALAAAVA